MKYLTALKHNDRQRRGFSLAETLIVVGILVILMGLLIPNLIQMQRNLRQKELDAKAELIYVAAQNELSKLRASGNAAAYKLSASTTGVSADPGDENVLLLACLSSTDSRFWLNKTADDTLLGNHWIVKYNKATGTVDEVFYCETEDLDASNYDTWRPDAETGRSEWEKKDIGKVGYYGGSFEGGAENSYRVKDIKIIPHNGEKLWVEFKFSIPNYPNGTNPDCTLTINGEEYPVEIARSFNTDDWYGTLILDSLDPNEGRFCEKFIDIHNDYRWGYPGDDLNMKLIVSGSDIATATASATVNSLFEKAEGNTAYISCGRHLQNLDEASCLPSSITAAVQTQTIYFGKNQSGEPSDWYNAYVSGPESEGRDAVQFKAISNSSLSSYNGYNDSKKAQTSIVDLTTVAENGNGGLFTKISAGPKAALSNIRLENAKISVPTATNGAANNLSTSVGTIVGTIECSCEMTGCRVYLTDTTGLKKDSVLIGGPTSASTGGLVGSITKGTVTIDNSFAATLIRGANAGGLVGSVSGESTSLAITHSYADCFVTGVANVGGLVGSGNVKKIERSYAAGFLTPVLNSAGFANGNVETLKDSYTVCDLGRGISNISNISSTAGSANEKKNVFYLVAGNSNLAGTEAIADLTTSYATSEDTMAYEALYYRLKDSGAFNNALDKNVKSVTHPYWIQRTNGKYPYPFLKETGLNAKGSIDHYGDWKSALLNGSVVYYEHYTIGDPYQYRVGLTDEDLRNDVFSVVDGDGYGIYFADAIPGGEVAVRLKKADGNYTDWETLSPATVFEAPITSDTGRAFCYVYPLPTNYIDIDPVGTGVASFWQEIEVKVGEGSPITSYYNPAFAMTYGGDPEAYPPTIKIRTPRQLYALSKYYTHWSDLNAPFVQERNLYYGSYTWSAPYTGWARPATQEPIGSEVYPFQSNYNGNCYQINGISIQSANASVGLFGTTMGYLNNIVLAENVDSGRFVKRTGSLGANQTAYMGTLVGHNRGWLDNCAVAGYRLMGSGTDGQISTLANSTLRVGGLVGRNDGTIQNSSVVLPKLDVDALYSVISAGGFIGQNRGAIRDSYAYAELVGNARDTENTHNVSVAGFAGTNVGGQISDSYCAAHIEASNMAQSFAFAPAGGIATNCDFLFNGTFSYLGELLSFGGDPQSSDGEGKTYDQMYSDQWMAPVAYTSYHSRTDGDEYPFRGKVRNAFGQYVHYGDWISGPALGQYGVFYWEREENGSNDGYHFSFLGMIENQPVSGSTLCNAHDDGGEVKLNNYGYGFYVMKGEKLAVTSSDDTIKWSVDNAGKPIVNQEAQKELERQLSDRYDMYPFTTAYPGEEYTGSNYIYLNPDNKAANGAAKKDVTNGKLTLTYTPKPDDTSAEEASGEEAAASYTFDYLLSPFFADAISRDKQKSQPPEKASEAQKNEWEDPGSKKNPYEVRSVQQLQYINWNSFEKNCTEKVTGDWHTGHAEDGNRKQFPFLQYATSLATNGSNRQTREAACGPNSPRPAQCWEQSHDLNGKNFPNFTPIASKATTNPGCGKDDVIDLLYAWFGGSYNGRTYKIQDLSITSNSYAVGLFGVTVGADIKNIILHGDGTTAITRTTSNQGFGAYQIGGLVGLAYDYDISADKVSTISNCAISGYKIIDACSDQHARGYASVGGLFGISMLKLERCSAVVDIEINYQSPLNGNGPNHRYSYYGNMIRVGGITGTALHQINNCYTGGSITVGTATLNESPDGIAKDGKADRYKALSIFTAGIAASTYKNGIGNFGATPGTTDGEVTINNCYTYMTLPSIVGNVRSSSIFVGSADRANIDKTKIHVSNSYFLESEVLKNFIWPYNEAIDSKEALAENKNPNYPDPTYYFHKVDNIGLYRMSNWEMNKTLYGDMDVVGKRVLGHTSSYQETNYTYKPNRNEEHSVDYAYLSGSEVIGKLGSDTWAPVTTSQGEGKYSFSPDPVQYGMDYPFPTVIRQIARDGVTVEANVHYGAWAYESDYWLEGRAEMEIFDNLKQTSVAPNARSEFSVVLSLENLLPSGSDYEVTGDAGFTKDDLTVTLTSGDNADAKLLRVAKESADSIRVTLSANPTGYAKLTASRIIPAEVEGGQNAEIKATAIVQCKPSEKVFTLHLGSPESVSANNIVRWKKTTSTTSTGATTDTFTEEGGDMSFTLSPAGMAQVVKANKNANGEIEVTLRALKTGSVKLTYGTNGAHCNVSINAALKVETNPTSYTFKNTESTQNPETVRVTCKATAYEATGDTDISGIGVWRFEAEEKNNTKLLLVESVQGSPNVFTIRRNGFYGSTAVSVNYTYLYYGFECEDTVIIPVTTMGYVGLSSGTNNYVAGTRVSADGALTFDKTNTIGLTKDPALPQGSDIVLFAPASENDLASFEINDITLVVDGTPLQLTRTESNHGVWNGTSNGADYCLTFDTIDSYGHRRVITDKDYQYSSATLRVINGDEKTVKVTMTLTDPRINNNSGSAQQYVLTLENVHACKYTVKFDSNKPVKATSAPTGSLKNVGIYVGVKLPNGGYTVPGYTFTGWNTYRDPYHLAPDTTPAAVSIGTSAITEEQYEALKEFSRNGEITLYAQWRPVAYTVYFTDDYSSVLTSDEMEAQELISRYVELPYTAEMTLPGAVEKAGKMVVVLTPEGVTPVEEFAVPEGYLFDGWMDAKGETHAAGDVILTEEGETVLLYARWKKISNILTLKTFDSASNEWKKYFSCRIRTDDSVTGIGNLTDSETSAPYQPLRPNENHQEFYGWFTSPDGEDGIRVLTANGSVVKDVSGDGFTVEIIDGTARLMLTKNVTLYPRWIKESHLTLVTGNTVEGPFTLMGGESITNLSELEDPEHEYTKPQFDNWELDGWYTSQTADGVKVLDENDAVIAGVSGEGFRVEVMDGIAKLKLTGDLTLYSRWKGKAYVQVPKLDNANGDGYYLIASGAATGTVTLMANTDNNNSKWTNMSLWPTATVRDNPIVNEAGQSLLTKDMDGNDLTTSLTWILDDGSFGEGTGARWRFQYQEQCSRPNYEPLPDHFRYIIFNEKELSLRDDRGGNGINLQMKKYWQNPERPEDGIYNPNGTDGAYYQGAVNNRNMWHYAPDALANTLISEFAYEANDRYSDGFRGVGYADSIWKKGVGYTCAIFREQDVYSFTPYT